MLEERKQSKAKHTIVLSVVLKLPTSNQSIW